MDTRANILVIGSRDALDSFRATTRTCLRAPVAVVRGSAVGPLHPAATLVIEDAHLLDASAQAAVAAWTAAPENADAQVISLTSRRLYPLVVAGDFDADLYYRLNAIVLNVDEEAR